MVRTAPFFRRVQTFVTTIKIWIRVLTSSCDVIADHTMICSSCQFAADIFACDVGQITGRFPRVFCPPEGRFAIVTKRGAGDAVDAADARDECTCHGRRSRGVLIPRRWYQACGDRRRPRRQQARLSGETTKETVKTIARGMPDVSGVTVVTCLRAFYFCTQGYGRNGRPAFPAPSDFGRDIVRNDSGV